MVIKFGKLCARGYDVSRLTRKATYTGWRPLLNSGVILKDFSPKDLWARHQDCRCSLGCQTDRYQDLLLFDILELSLYRGQPDDREHRQVNPPI
jgi:hypothetical protein